MAPNTAHVILALALSGCIVAGPFIIAALRKPNMALDLSKLSAAADSVSAYVDKLKADLAATDSAADQSAVDALADKVAALVPAVEAPTE